MYFLLQLLGSDVLTEILLGVGILAIIIIILKLAKSILKLVAGIIINSILGFFAIFLLNAAFNLGIPFSIPIIVSTAIFGLPAVGTLAILKLAHVSLVSLLITL